MEVKKVFYKCDICCVSGKGNQKFIQGHEQGKRHLKALRRLSIERMNAVANEEFTSGDFRKVNESIKNLPNFQSQAEELLHQLQSPRLLQKLKTLRTDLQNILQEVFHGCIVHLFHNTGVELGITNNSVQFYLQVFRTNETLLDRVHKCQEVLKKNHVVFSETRAIRIAKKHAIECIHNSTKIKCVINFADWLCVHKSSLVQYYLSLNDKLKLAMVILQHWAQTHKLVTGPEGFTNYILAILLIFFLQQIPYLLPPAMSLQASPNCVHPQKGWSGEFIPLRGFMSKPLANESLSQILHAFFRYYSDFDYGAHVICPYLGHPVPKTGFLNPKSLPDELDRYKANIMGAKPFKVLALICVQDPLEQNLNIMQSVCDAVSWKFMELCKLSADNLRPYPIHRSALYELFTTDKQPHTKNILFLQDAECKFTIPMDYSLLYLYREVITSDIAMDSYKSLNRIRKAWCSLVKNFILMVLTDFMGFSVSIKKDYRGIKSRRLTKQADVHDTNLIDSAVFHCFRSGVCDFSVAMERKVAASVAKGEAIFVGLPVGKQMSFMRQLILPDMVLKQLRVSIELQAKIKPSRMILHAVQLNPGEKNGKSFLRFLTKLIPWWFNKYAIELDRITRSKNIQPEKCSNVQLKSDLDGDEWEDSNEVCIQSYEFKDVKTELEDADDGSWKDSNSACNQLGKVKTEQEDSSDDQQEDLKPMWIQQENCTKIKSEPEEWDSKESVCISENLPWIKPEPGDPENRMDDVKTEPIQPDF